MTKKIMGRRRYSRRKSQYRRGHYLSEFMSKEQIESLKKCSVGYAKLTSTGGFLLIKIGKEKGKTDFDYYYIGLKKLHKLLRGESPFAVVYTEKIFELSK